MYSAKTENISKTETLALVILRKDIIVPSDILDSEYLFLKVSDKLTHQTNSNVLTVIAGKLNYKRDTFHSFEKSHYNCKRCSDY